MNVKSSPKYEILTKSLGAFSKVSQKTRAVEIRIINKIENFEFE